MQTRAHHPEAAALTVRRVVLIAVPVMVSNVSTPLIGVVDTAILGRIPDPAYIGAIAVGALLFTLLFWAFGFLRMGTTGLTAQALGAGQSAAVGACLGRALAVAAILGSSLIVLQRPISALAFRLLEGSGVVEALAGEYFDIRIWAAPATLANYALLGWFIGLGRTDIGLMLQLVLNIANIVFDAFFVLALGWDVAGVAAGTLLAEYLALVFGLGLAFRHCLAAGFQFDRRLILAMPALKRTLSINFDIMVRSLALIFVFLWFMSRGARQGDVVLAANAVLMQFVSVSAFFLDGLAFAAETLVGQAAGARLRGAVIRAAWLTSLLALDVALLLAGLLAAFAGPGIDFLTVDAATRELAREFLPWVIGAPLMGVLAFQLDGIFIGATRTREMRSAMLFSTAVFILAWWLLTPWGNHGLWAALYINYVARIASLGSFLPGLLRAIGAQEPASAS